MDKPSRPDGAWTFTSQQARPHHSSLLARRQAVCSLVASEAQVSKTAAAEHGQWEGASRRPDTWPAPWAAQQRGASECACTTTVLSRHRQVTKAYSKEHVRVAWTLIPRQLKASTEKDS